MNSIFLRIYGGMLAALVMVALLGVGTLQVVNGVRTDQYREGLARGTLRLMADNLQPMTDVERRRALAMWSRLFGVQLDLAPLASLSLDAGSRNRLVRNRLLVKLTGEHSARFYSLVNDPQYPVLTGEIRQVSEHLARATNYLLIDELIRYPVAEQPQRLAELKVGKGFGFDMALVRLDEARLDPDQRRRIVEGDTVLALGQGGDSIHVFSGVGDTPWVLQIGPLYQMNRYPPELLALIVVLGLSLIGLTIYLLVRSLEQRLRALEGAATHIASGRLDARVPTRGADSVGRLASSFNAMAEHLQRSLSTQRELVRAVSHELRTPVARLRFGLEMIADAPSDAARRKYMDGMDSDIQDLDKLVDEMLTYARLEQGSPALSFVSVEICALLTRVIDELGPLSSQVKVSLGSISSVHADDEDATVEAEPRYLHRAVQNLVSNAMRYAESQVVISCQVGLKRCRIDVEDDGPGVPQEAWERLFSPFERLDDSRTRSSGGHGLGLSIVRRIIYWHGGRAQIGRSERLGGARFSLVWPRRQNEENA